MTPQFHGRASSSLKALSSLAFDVLFWTPFWLVPLLATGNLQTLPFLKNAVTGIAFSALWALIANLAGRHRRPLYLVMGLLLWAGAAAFIAYMVSTHARINAFGLFDASQFVTRDTRMLRWVTGIGHIMLWLAAITAPFALLAYCWKTLPAKADWRLACALAALSTFPFLLRDAPCALVECVPESPAIIASNIVRHYPAFASYLALDDLLALRANLAAIANKTRKTARAVSVETGNPITVVVVVGETLNRNHMGIYGYCRDTTPNLARTADLYRFDNFVSLIPSTALAVPAALVEQHSNSSVIDLMNEGKFSTYWISTQSTFSEHSSETIFWAGRAQHVNFLAPPLQEGAFFVKDTSDEKLLAPLESAIGSAEPRKAIFLHMNGAHFTYTDRYPPGYLPEGFLALRGQRSTEQRRVIDEYDRAMHFDDAIFGKMIAMARQKGGDIALVIFSDHGEEVYDQQPWYTHVFPGSTRGMVEPPLLIWLSPSLRAHQPALANAVQSATGKPLMISDLPAILMDLAGISVDGLSETANPLSPNMRAEKRFSGKHDYDADRNLGVRPLLPPLCPEQPDL